MTALTSPDQVITAIDQRLANLLTEAATLAGDLSPSASLLMGPIEDLSISGKRIRGVAVRWGFEAAGRDASAEPGIDLVAAGVELLHAAALIHDDIIDASATRRGKPSVHTAFATLHRDGDYAGSAELYGEGAAIVAGDLCLALSEQAIAGSGLEHLNDPAALDVRAALRRDVMVGQFLDIHIQAAPVAFADIQDRAFEVITNKAAKYSVEHPLLLGAALGGAPRELMEALSAFGLPLGQAFQLRDDELGVFGDPRVTGKPAGDDLIQGKRTVLVGLALTRLNEEDAEWFAAHLGAVRSDSDDLQRLKDLLVGSGAVDEHEALIAATTDKARQGLEALENAGLSDADVSMLSNFADRLTTRNT